MKKTNQVGVISLHAIVLLVLVVVTIGTVGAYVVFKSNAAKPGPKSSVSLISIAAPASPYHLDDVLTFNYSVEQIAGWEYPMIAISCYQDVNGDGGIDTTITSPDIVYSWVDKPSAQFQLGAYSSIWKIRGGGAAKCRADLDAYGWKGGVQNVRVLASIPFEALDK